MLLLKTLGLGAVIGLMAFLLVKPLIGWWLEKYRGITTPRPVFSVRELVAAALIGVVTYTASFMGPLKSGGLERAYNDLCTTISRDSLASVMGEDYGETDTGLYLNGAFQDNCPSAE